MSGHGISSNNHIRKRKLQRNWALVQMRHNCSSYVIRKRKNEHEKINGWENGKHVTCHSEWHDTSTTVGSGHWYKNLPYLKRTWPYELSHVGSAARKELAAECQLTYQEVKILTCGQYPSITLKNKKSQRQRSDLEKLMCNPSLLNKEHKNEWALLPSHLEWVRIKMSYK